MKPPVRAGTRRKVESVRRERELPPRAERGTASLAFLVRFLAAISASSRACIKSLSWTFLPATPAVRSRVEQATRRVERVAGPRALARQRALRSLMVDLLCARATALPTLGLQ